MLADCFPPSVFDRFPTLRRAKHHSAPDNRAFVLRGKISYKSGDTFVWFANACGAVRTMKI